MYTSSQNSCVSVPFGEVSAPGLKRNRRGATPLSRSCARTRPLGAAAVPGTAVQPLLVAGENSSSGLLTKTLLDPSGARCPLALRQMIARQKALSAAQGFLVTVIAEGITLGDERRAGVKHFILQMPPGKLRSHNVPCQLEQLHALFEGNVRRAP